ncbi:MAG: hypothetical protein C0497_04235 [Gemmatimonas sp.]|nr:hypothetical protein [Gemmatimonas sp.]
MELSVHTPPFSPVEGTVTIPFLPDYPLQVGTLERRRDDRVALIPPEIPMYRQVLTALRAMPAAPDDFLLPKPLAVATAGILVRWGSYFAVLCERTSTGAALRHRGACELPAGIADAEMCRMNLEVSAGLEEWLSLARYESREFTEMARRALQYLPHPVLRLRRAARLRADVFGPPLLATPRVTPSFDQMRRLANHVALYCWRNGLIEDMHAGAMRGLLAARQEGQVLRDVGERLAGVLTALGPFDDMISPDWEEATEMLLSLGFAGEPDWSETVTGSDIVWPAGAAWPEPPEVAACALSR